MLLRILLNDVIYIEFLGFRRNKSLENFQGRSMAFEEKKKKERLTTSRTNESETILKKKKKRNKRVVIEIFIIDP